MSIYFDVRKHFGKFLTGEENVKEFDNITKKVAYNVVEREYISQAPPDTGNFRRSIRTVRLGNMAYMVRPYAESSKGFNYPEALYHGTGKYKGSADMGVRGVSRIRQSNFYGFGNRQDMIGFFAGLKRRGIKTSIRPNKVAKRTVDSTKEQSNALIKQEILKLINR